MKKQIKMILVVAIILIIAVFAILNIQSVSVNFGFGQLKLPMIIMLILWILIGALIDFLISTSSSFSRSRNSRKLTKEYDNKVTQLQTQISQLQKQLKQKNISESNSDKSK